MRIPLHCMNCFQEYGEPSDYFFPAEVKNDGRYTMTCQNGHETITCLQEHKFEILFELGANAIIDNYYREAVSSFTSSLERFYEFYIHVISCKNNILEENLTETWKKVAAQSERQFGAYMFCYLTENGEVPSIPTQNSVAFRNSVIHKGVIPTRCEAIDYGQSIIDIIAPILKILKERYSEHVRTVVWQHIKSTRAQIKVGEHVSTMSIPTTISIARGNSEPQPTLDETLKRLAKSYWRQ